jgi:hypothetical protein
VKTLFTELYYSDQLNADIGGDVAGIGKMRIKKITFCLENLEKSDHCREAVISGAKLESVLKKKNVRM